MKASPEQILVEGADPNDACGFVRTDGIDGDPSRGFFWCVCADECRCEHCKERFNRYEV